MAVTVVLVGAARELFGRPSYTVDLKPGMTIRGLFEELSRSSGPGFEGKIYDVHNGRMNEHIVVFINSREIRSLEGLDTRLKEGDVITILPPMAGG